MPSRSSAIILLAVATAAALAADPGQGGTAELIRRGTAWAAGVLK